MFARSGCILRGPLFKSPFNSLFSTSAVQNSRNNPRRYAKTILDVPEHQQAMFKDKLEYEYPDGLEGFGVRPIGVKLASNGRFVIIPEMIPELVVPDLSDFKLKAYVSFKVPDIKEPPLTARDLFDAVYGRPLKEAFEAGKLDAEVEDLKVKQREGKLKVATYDREPPRMLDSSKVPVV